MNQFFNFNRFLLLVGKHWADHRKRYLLSIAAFIGLLITWFIFTMLTIEDLPMSRMMQNVTYFISLLFIGTFYASQYFRDLGSRAKGINFLLVPASAFEKLLCSILYTVLFFFVAFTASFYLVDWLMVSIAKSIYGPGGSYPNVINVFKVSVVRFNNSSNINFLLFIFSIQSIFLLGSVYFEKYSYIKTIISAFVAMFILFCLLYFFNENLLPNGDYPRGFLNAYRIHVDGVNDHLVQVPRWIGAVFQYTMMYGMGPFFWLVTYFRLKEKQV